MILEALDEYENDNLNYGGFVVVKPGLNNAKVKG
jgi:hypothetical protein